MLALTLEIKKALFHNTFKTYFDKRFSFNVIKI